mgnify:CR=1 FL=1
MSDAAPIETRDESLAAEAKRCWDAVPDKALFLGLLAAWAVGTDTTGQST